MFELIKALCLITGAAFWGLILMVLLLILFFASYFGIEELIENLKVKIQKIK